MGRGAEASEAGPPVAPGEDLSGRLIDGRYRLEGRIADGGMATVWRATHLTLQSQVAIKFLQLVGPRAPEISERFLREAKVAAAIRHRNVVDIVDFGTADDGKPYMVMELLVGQTLADRLSSREPMTVADSLGIVTRVLAGLGAVHDVGIVHRDLKPENVFLVSEEEGCFPKLLDFGVSRAVDPRTGLKSVLPTCENAIVGTPQYMSPEQARGLHDVDHRSDIWSAGVMLYEMLSGELPFDGEAPGDVIVRIATEEPLDFRHLRPDLGGPLPAVIHRAMARDPKDRFQSAREMRAALVAAAAKTARHLRGQAGGGRSAEIATLMQLPNLLSDEHRISDEHRVSDEHRLEDSLSDQLGFADLDSVEAFIPQASARVAGLTEVTASARRWWPAAGRWAAGALVLAGTGLVFARLSAGAEPDPPPALDSAISNVDAPAESMDLGDAEHATAIAAPRDTVVVQLGGVPDQAQVRVDGDLRAGARLELPRGAQPHDIEVVSTTGRWSTTFIATADAELDVELEPNRLASQGTASHRIESQGIASQGPGPNRLAPHRLASHRIESQGIASQSQGVASRRFESQGIASRRRSPRHKAQPPRASRRRTARRRRGRRLRRPPAAVGARRADGLLSDPGF